MLVLLAGLQGTIVYGQALSARTNDIHLEKTGVGGIEDNRLPVVTWLTPKMEYTNSSENTVNIKAMVSSVHGVKEMYVVVGDNATGEEYSRKYFENSVAVHGVFRIDETLKLPGGSNYIELVVSNDHGSKVSSTRNVTVGMDAIVNLISIDRKDYALMFATDKYEHWDDLVNPIDDAHSIAKELREIYGFEVEIVENPTMEEVWEKLREYNERQFKPQDQLMVFFAGHGHFDDTFGEGYVVAKNSLQNDLSRSTYISHNRLRGVISNIPSEHTLLLMDVCFGGTLDPLIARARGLKEYEAAPWEVVARKLSYRTRKYITSGGKEYVSDGIPGQHSPFAAKLIEALKSRGGSDQLLTLSEVKASLESLKQVPRFGSFGDDDQQSDFVFIVQME